MGAIAIAPAAPRLGTLTGITYEHSPRRLNAARRHIDMRLYVKPETRRSSSD
jgi:hypothetical protein